MPHKHFEQLKRSLQVIENTTYEATADNKLFKIRAMIEGIRNNYVKIEPEEYQSVDEQIIPSKSRQTKTQQYSPKRLEKRCFNNLVRAGASGLL